MNIPPDAPLQGFRPRSRLRTILYRMCLVAPLLFSTAGEFATEVHCEEAVKHLADCCPGLSPGRFECEYGCNGGPNFDQSTSDCLLALDCATLVGRGVCARLAKRATPVDGDASSVDDERVDTGVCP